MYTFLSSNVQDGPIYTFKESTYEIIYCCVINFKSLLTLKNEAKTFFFFYREIIILTLSVKGICLFNEYVQTQIDKYGPK